MEEHNKQKLKGYPVIMCSSSKLFSNSKKTTLSTLCSSKK